jgi:hypothetical protein
VTSGWFFLSTLLFVGLLYIMRKTLILLSTLMPEYLCALTFKVPFLNLLVYLT